MTEEEKQAIERLNRDINTPLYGRDTTIVLKEDIETVLNLIQKQNKVIDEMAEYIEKNSCEGELDNIYAELHNTNGLDRNWNRGKEAELKDIKEYFIKKVEEK